jgi:hypothetical protein
MRPILPITLVLTAVLLVPPLPTNAAVVAGPSIASFEGGYIDLRAGWGEAGACTSDGVTTECFRTEKEMDEHVDDPVGDLVTRVLGLIGIQAVCSTTLRLYANTSYGGSVLALSTRFTVLNLATWSFSNVTSSYKVGACSSTFYDGANAVPPVYPGSTAAGASATSMSAGWDNRVSSVYIS